MPELPDLEVFKQNLLKNVINKTILETACNSEKSLINTSADEFIQQTEQSQFTDISRRGKHLIFHLKNNSKLILHLMLRGRLEYGDIRMTDDFKDCFGFSFDDATTLKIIDPSHWVKLEVLEDGSLEDSKLLKGLGPEADEISLDEFTDVLKRSKIGRIKPLLMDQKKIAGIGNAYADEILWESKIHPNKTASMLSDSQINELHENIKKVLKWGIEQSKNDVGDKFEESGRKWMHVYRKESTECPRCKTTIKHLKVNQRDTFVCPTCQEVKSQL